MRATDFKIKQRNLGKNKKEISPHGDGAAAAVHFYTNLDFHDKTLEYTVKYNHNYINKQNLTQTCIFIIINPHIGPLELIQLLTFWLGLS